MNTFFALILDVFASLGLILKGAIDVVLWVGDMLVMVPLRYFLGNMSPVVTIIVGILLAILVFLFCPKYSHYDYKARERRETTPLIAYAPAVIVIWNGVKALL